MSEQKNTQEIDLIELFSNMGKWISKWVSKLFNSVVLASVYFLLRNAVYFILFVVVGVILGFAMSQMQPKFFRSECIAFSHTISNLEVIRYINSWNYDAEFTEEELANIKTIQATYLLDINEDGVWDIVEEPTSEKVLDTTVMKQRLYGNFCLLIEVYDTALLNKIQTKAFDYLTNNTRVQKRNEIRIKQLNQLIPKYKKEISDLDSLKKSQYFENSKEMQRDKGSLLIWNEKELNLLHDDIIALYKEQLEVEKRLYLFDEPYEVITNFNKPKEPENNLFSQVKKFSLLMFGVGFVVIFLMDRRKFIARLLKDSKAKK